jgi:hypothetical protein
MHDGNHVHMILASTVDDAVRETHDSALSYIVSNTTIKKWISSNAVALYKRQQHSRLPQALLDEASTAS